LETHIARKSYTVGNPIRRVYFIGDTHLGVVNCAEGKIKEAVKTIKADKDAYWIGMGDYCDFVVPGDPRFDLNQIAEWVDKTDIVRSQANKAIELLAPIKDKNLCMLMGNHEYKYMVHSNNNVQAWITDGLGAKNAGYSCFLKLVYERENSAEHHSYIGALTHGGSCASTESGKRTALGKWMMHNVASFYAMGHVHTVDFLDRAPLGVSQDMQIENKEILGVISGCFLKTYEKGIYPSYGEMRSYGPTVLGYSMIEFNVVDSSMTFRKKIYTKAG